MAMPNVSLQWHVWDPALFREAITFTARQLQYSPRLIEKDYFCSVVLAYLTEVQPPLHFKGGTCLSKVHRKFHRLSEDLDFTVSTAVDASRTERRRLLDPYKQAVAGLPDSLAGLHVARPLTGANNSTQYNATAAYTSLLDKSPQTIRVEISIREPTLEPHAGFAGTILLDPITERRLIDDFPVCCLSYQEAMAEKVRAAMCRREVAIRDYFDVDHAVETGSLSPLEPGFLALVQRKIRVPGTGPVHISAQREEQLEGQLLSELQPVLREREFAAFSLARSLATMRSIAKSLSPPAP